MVRICVDNAARNEGWKNGRLPALIWLVEDSEGHFEAVHEVRVEGSSRLVQCCKLGDRMENPAGHATAWLETEGSVRIEEEGKHRVAIIGGDE